MASQAGGITQRQFADAFKVRQIQCEQGQTMRNGSCCYEEIWQCDKLIGRPKVVIDLHCGADAGGIKWQDRR